MYFLIDLYAEIILCEHVNKDDDVSLPMTIQDEHGNPKATFSELEVTQVDNICIYPCTVHTNMTLEMYDTWCMVYIPILLTRSSYTYIFTGPYIM